MSNRRARERRFCVSEPACMNIQSPVSEPGTSENAPLLPRTEEPIRLSVLNEDNLGRLGERIARSEAAGIPMLQPFDFHGRLAEDARKILDTYVATSAVQARGEMITPAAQW